MEAKAPPPKRCGIENIYIYVILKIKEANKNKIKEANVYEVNLVIPDNSKKKPCNVPHEEMYNYPLAR